MEECRAPAPTPGSPLNREWALAIQHCNSRRDVRTAHFALPLNPAHERTRTRTPTPTHSQHTAHAVLRARIVTRRGPSSADAVLRARTIARLDAGPQPSRLIAHAVLCPALNFEASLSQRFRSRLSASYKREAGAAAAAA